MYTNRTGSTLNLNLYDPHTVPFYTLQPIRGGSNCQRICTSKCSENCYRYCSDASKDTVSQREVVKKLEEELDRLRKKVSDIPVRRKTAQSQNQRHREQHVQQQLHQQQLHQQQLHQQLQQQMRQRTQRPPEHPTPRLVAGRTRRTRRKRGGFGFFGSTTSFKPCEIDCKANCASGCKTICEKAAKETLSNAQKERINQLNREIDMYNRIISSMRD